MTKKSSRITRKSVENKGDRGRGTAHGTSSRSGTETKFSPPIWISLAQIDLTEEDRLRENDSMETVEEYVEVYRQNMQDGMLVKGENQTKFPFPPCGVYKKANGRWGLTLGRHRALAAQEVGLTQIWCTIYSDEKEAVWDGLGDNRKNGLRNSPSDLRKMIRIALQQYPDKSQRLIAEHIGCSSTYVDRIAKEYQAQTGEPLPQTRTSRNGKQYPSQQPKKKDETPLDIDSGSGPDAPNEPETQASATETSEHLRDLEDADKQEKPDESATIELTPTEAATPSGLTTTPIDVATDIPKDFEWHAKGLIECLTVNMGDDLPSRCYALLQDCYELMDDMQRLRFVSKFSVFLQGQGFGGDASIDAAAAEDSY